MTEHYTIRILTEDGEVFDDKHIDAAYEHTAGALFTSTVDLLRRMDHGLGMVLVQLIEPGETVYRCDVRYETRIES